MAAAARLAKLGHAVTLLEQADELGGAVRRLTREGFTWDLGPASMPLPAAIRDLFRKSGRPLERVVDLVPVETPRRHVFPDGSTLDVPLTGRAGQEEALGAAWTALIDGLVPTWELLRTRVLEVPHEGLRLPELYRLRPWRSLRAVGRRALRDPRARHVLEYVATGAGSDPARTPGFVAVQAYVERTFGRWTCAGGLGELVTALAGRLDERDVDVRLGSRVASVVSGDGAVRGVRLDSGELVAADIVVSGAPDPSTPRRPGKLRLAQPARTVLLGLRSASEAPFETVLHGSPLLVLEAPAGSATRTLRVLGEIDPDLDPLDLLAQRGVDIRQEWVQRFDVDGLSYGPVWDGVRTARSLAPNRDSVRGLFHVGAHAHPGPGLPYVLLGAATVAGLIGKA
ncbi:phytoene desaturase family protein [Flindersiella endophytica]